MWLYILAGLAVLVVVVTVTRNAFRRGVRNEMVAFLKEERPSWAVKGDALTQLTLVGAAEDEVTFNLTKLFLAAASIPSSNPQNRRPLYEQSLAALEEGISMQRPSLAEHGNRILPQLVRQEFLRDVPALVRRPLNGTPLHIVYVLDGSHSVSYISTETRVALALTEDALHERALQNLATRLTADVVQTALAGAVAVVKSGDTFDAARLLVVPSLLKPGETLAAIVSDRDTLALCPAPADGEWEKLHQLARSADGATLLDVPVKVSSHGFETAL